MLAPIGAVPSSQAEDLAAQIARLWPVEGYGTALDLGAAFCSFWWD